MDQWRCIFNFLFPNPDVAPMPCVPTIGMIEAVARNPPSALIEYLVPVFNTTLPCQNGAAEQVRASLGLIGAFINYVRREGPEPALPSIAVANARSNVIIAETDLLTPPSDASNATSPIIAPSKSLVVADAEDVVHGTEGLESLLDIDYKWP